MTYFEFLLLNAFEKLTEAAKAYALGKKGTESHNDFAAEQKNLMDSAIGDILQIEIADENQNWTAYREAVAKVLKAKRKVGEDKLKSLSDRSLDLRYFDRYSDGILSVFDELDELFKEPALKHHRHENHTQYISNPSLYRMFIDVLLNYKVMKIIEYQVKIDDKSPSHTSVDKMQNLLLTLNSWHDELSKHNEKPKGKDAAIFSNKVTSIIDKFFEKESELQYQGRKGKTQALLRKGFTLFGQSLGFNIGGDLGKLLEPFVTKYDPKQQYQWEPLPAPSIVADNTPAVTREESIASTLSQSP